MTRFCNVINAIKKNECVCVCVWSGSGSLSGSQSRRHEVTFVSTFLFVAEDATGLFVSHVYVFGVERVFMGLVFFPLETSLRAWRGQCVCRSGVGVMRVRVMGGGDQKTR